LRSDTEKLANRRQKLLGDAADDACTKALQASQHLLPQASQESQQSSQQSSQQAFEHLINTMSERAAASEHNAAKAAAEREAMSERIAKAERTLAAERKAMGERMAKAERSMVEAERMAANMAAAQRQTFEHELASQVAKAAAEREAMSERIAKAEKAAMSVCMAAAKQAALATAAEETAHAEKAKAEKAEAERAAAMQSETAAQYALQAGKEEAEAQTAAAEERATAAEREVEHLGKKLAVAASLEPRSTPAEPQRSKDTSVDILPGCRLLCEAVTASVCATALPELEMVAQNADTIFNPDDKRRQMQVDASQSAAAAMLDALRTAGELRGRRARVFNAIHSRKGCREQPWHTDHDPVPLARMRRKPRSAILALQPGARLLIAVKGVVHEVRLEVGDILVFDGDVVHAGAAYAEANTRLHAYLDIVGVERPHNETYVVEN